MDQARSYAAIGTTCGYCGSWVTEKVQEIPGLEDGDMALPRVCRLET